MRRIVLAFICLFTPASVFSEEVWQDLGTWTIHIRTDDATRCFASRFMENGTEVEIGTEPTLDGGFFAIYNPEWTQIEDGQDGFVEFHFGTSRYGGEAVGRYKDGIPGGYVFFNNPEFVQDFARRQTVKISGRGGATFEMDLTGTSRAIRGVLECQDAQPDPTPSE